MRYALQPCLARAVILAREGQTVIYVVPDAPAGRQAHKDLARVGAAVASVQFGILTFGVGSLQILPEQGRDLCDTVRGRAGLIVLHKQLRASHDWRAGVRARNGHRYGAMLAARADALEMSLTLWAGCDPAITTLQIERA